MKKNKKKLYMLLATLVATHLSLQSRNVHRKQDPDTPCLSARWSDNDKISSIASYHLDPYPLFDIFDQNFFNNHLLPKTPLAFRYELNKKVDTSILISQIDTLMTEIKHKKRSYTHFKVLQHKDFNRRKKHGLLILKFNDYPFVVKVFIERPDSFTSPYHKGIEPIFFFYMGGGINRHLAGFTRLKNLEQIKQKLAQDSTWNARVDLPRKWYWIPKDSRWITLHGKNMGPNKETREAKIPGTYCIIADAIEPQQKFSLLDRPEDTKVILDLCNYVNQALDPHLNNYFIEKNTNKLIPIDTEHFASFVGLKEPVNFVSYPDWYLKLAGKFLKSSFFQTKWERKHHRKPHESLLLS